MNLGNNKQPIYICDKCERMINNRKDVNYNGYVKNYNCNGLYYIYCFIPVIRILIIGLILLISYGPKETLDKLFKYRR